jgi:hypothetical protein
MTLIELLFAYQTELRLHGRQEANEWLMRVSEPNIHKDVQYTFNDKGDFIDTYGERMSVVNLNEYVIRSSIDLDNQGDPS